MERMITGVGAAGGRHRGPVRVVHGEAEFAMLRQGEVLVCAVASPAWTVLFGRAGAVLTDRGGTMSNPAIVAREYGIPAVVGTGDGTSALRDGQIVTVDGDDGVVWIDPDPGSRRPARVGARSARLDSEELREPLLSS